MRYRRVAIWILSLPAALAAGCAMDGPAIEPGDDQVAELERELPSEVSLACTSTCTADQMIIGCDDRYAKPPETNGANTRPWSFIGRFHGEGGGRCSGALIGNRWVLTAAHCRPGNPTKPYGFALAQEVDAGVGRPFGTNMVTRFHSQANFVGTDNPWDRVFDYAVVELFNPIAGAQRSNYANFAHLPWNTIQDNLARSVGYPGVAPDNGFDGRPWSTTGKPFQAEQPYLGGSGFGLLLTALDGTGGQSGAPVYVSQSGVRTVVGVMVGSPEDNCLAGENWASRLTPVAMAQIDQLMAGTPSSTFWSTTSFPEIPDKPPGETWPSVPGDIEPGLFD